MTNTQVTTEVGMETQNQPISWENIPWNKIEKKVFKLQKRIYRASLSGNVKVVRKLQKTLSRSWYAKLKAVRKVTQENKGRKTAGIDGVKSLNPKQRIKLASNLKIDGRSQATRRVWIPKNGKNEMRPLGIPTMIDRAKQTLIKMALEPEWEARFEPNSYGFRVGRSCHDAIAAIFACINKKPKYVLDADIAKCFDQIDHRALIKKINTFPKFQRQIKAWLTSGVTDFSQWAERKGYSQTIKGTPQGGSISPLLANIALHGLEELLNEYYPCDSKGRLRNCKKITGRNDVQAPRLIRFADDFVVLCDDLTIVQNCQTIIARWLKDIGLELKPSKTRLAHTLNKLGKEKEGFNFLGFEVRQFQVGKHHSGKSPSKKKLGFKTIIRPSQDKINQHYLNIKEKCDKMKTVAQASLIKELNPIIRGWCNYQSPWHSAKSYSKVKNLLWKRLWKWAKRRHPNKNKKWIANKYFLHTNEWRFAKFRDGENPLKILYHTDFQASIKWVKVQGTRSPYDGDSIYWATRIGDKYKSLEKQKARLVKRQKGKCAYCGLHFGVEDELEKHHVEHKSKGGKHSDKNLALVHLHCHDQIHSSQKDVNKKVIWNGTNKLEVV